MPRRFVINRSILLSEQETTYSEGKQLHIRIVMTDATLKRLDCILGRDLLGPDLIAYLEIQCQVF